MEHDVRVLFSCTSVGISNRGIESFFRESFDSLRLSQGLECTLLKGGGAPGFAEYRVFCLSKMSSSAFLVAKLLGRSPYTIEQLSSFPAVVRHVLRFRPAIVFTSDASLNFLLRRFRRRFGVPFKVLFSNGGPCHPPFDRYDYVHQVAPFYQEEALAAGEPSGKHICVPYGISVKENLPPSLDEKRAARARLGLPQDRSILLSVGWIARQHKRMHHVIQEVARLPSPRPFVQLLGAIDDNSIEIIRLAEEKLGPGQYNIRSVPYADVFDFYKAADLFVLASLSEGFGRVYLESLMHGLPTLGHAHPVIRYVLGVHGTITDMETPGGLAGSLDREFSKLVQMSEKERMTAAMARHEEVSRRFSWDSLRSEYVRMFHYVAEQPLEGM